MITEPLVTHVPPAPCGVPAIAERIAQIAGVPAGIEFIPACAQTEPRQPRDGHELSLLGMTAQEALDRLVALDLRYRWSESDGVIVPRPLEAWVDADHFLNATIPQFGFADQNVVGDDDVLPSGATRRICDVHAEDIRSHRLGHRCGGGNGSEGQAAHRLSNIQSALMLNFLS